MLFNVFVCGFVVVVVFFSSAQRAKMTTKSLAESSKWISELPCSSSLAGLISEWLQGKKPDHVSLYECRYSINRCSGQAIAATSFPHTYNLRNG